MARLIEFFTRTGELVLDPFAGVGGTLLGAAIARGPRRAIGIELDPRWVARLSTRPSRRWAPSATARARCSPTLAPTTRAASGRSSRRRSRCARATHGTLLPGDPRRVDRLRRHRPAVQRPAADDDGRRQARRGPRQPADRLRDGERPPARTSPTCPTTRRTSTRWAASSREVHRVLRPGRYAVLIVRDAYQDGRYLFTGRRPRGARRRRGPRAEGRHRVVPGRDAAAAVRLSAGVRAQHRAPAHPGAAQAPGRGAARAAGRRDAARPRPAGAAARV